VTDVFDAEAAAELFRSLSARLEPLRHRGDLHVASLVVNVERVDVVVCSGDDEWHVVFASNDGTTVDWVSIFERPPPFDGVAGGRAVVVNGPSSAGKSTLLAELQAQSEVPWVVFDEPFLGSVKQEYLIWRDRGDVLHRGFVEGIAALARAGNCVAVAAGGHPQSTFEAALVGVPTVRVGLHCATDELVKREQTRRDVAGGLALGSLAVHDGWEYDLTFDTATQQVSDIAAAVLRAVDAVGHGSRHA
jgi:chloramphenicol 3-O phosphotransferase